MIVSVIDYVDPPFEVSFVVSDLDLVLSRGEVSP